MRNLVWLVAFPFVITAIAVNAALNRFRRGR